MHLFKQPTHKLTLAIFGGLVLAILAAIASIIIMAVQRAPYSASFAGTPATALLQKTPVEITKKYISDLSALRQSLDSYRSSGADLFSFLNDALLVMRVPKEMLDPHIATVLYFQKEAQNIDKAVSIDKKNIDERLSALITEAKKYE